LRITNRVRMILLAAWLGAAIYFSIVVAPSAFGVLRSFSLPNANEIAGTIVTRSLAVVNKSGALLSVLLLLTSVSVRKCYGRVSFIFQNVLLVIILISTAVGQWVIAPRMVELRATMRGQIDQIPLSDPARMAFSTLHQYSVAALSIAMIAALVVLVLMALGRNQTANSTA
jgi:uncharacterized protein DUF4149